jgi:hypothetical protein
VVAASHGAAQAAQAKACRVEEERMRIERELVPPRPPFDERDGASGAQSREAELAPIWQGSGLPEGDGATKAVEEEGK